MAHAIGAAALASTGTLASSRALNAASPGGVVPRRVACLLRPRGSTAAPVLVLLPLELAIFSLVRTGEAVYDLGELLVAALHGRRA